MPIQMIEFRGVVAAVNEHQINHRMPEGEMRRRIVAELKRLGLEPKLKKYQGVLVVPEEKSVLVFPNCEGCGTTLKWYGRFCSRKCRHKHTYIATGYREKPCLKCGQMFKPPAPARDYCDACRAPVVFSKDCPQCKVTFSTRRSKQRFCSWQCTHKFNLKPPRQLKNPPPPKKTIEPGTCLYCSGEMPIPRVRHLKFCSHKCGTLSMRNTPAARIRKAMARRIRDALKTNFYTKAQSTMRYVGCTPRKLIAHLQGQFVEGMTWQNYGTEWEIDHHMPTSAFNCGDLKQANVAFHFTNLRPLWKHLNHAKSNLLHNTIPPELARRATDSGALILHG